MAITNAESGTRVDEVADGISKISTPVGPAIIPGGFTFNQYLIVDDEPLLYHTGLRKMFPLVREAIASVMPVARLRHIAFSHVEADECGALNQWLGAAPQATPLCGRIAASVSIEDLADRMPREIADGASLPLGKHTVQWFDTPHLPHAWECGHLLEQCTRTLFCGDLLSQAGDQPPPVTESDILGLRRSVHGWTISHIPGTRVRCWSGWRHVRRPRSRVCMGVPGVATARRCCTSSPLNLTSEQSWKS
jgi:glyoxylase-like metal-dependent hydrolase (beta-lactamase superfamily II)